MSVILGIDLGTSSVKTMLLDSGSGVIATEAVSYDVSIPAEGYAEQDPDMWWDALKSVLERLRTRYLEEYNNIKAIGLSGQMHGLVMLGSEGTPLRPAILWLDQRSEKQVRKIQEEMSMEDMGEIFCNRVAVGFAFPSLLWVRENEPELFSRINKIMMPKDYIRCRLTGNMGSDVSDASSSILFDTKHRRWSREVIRRFHLPENIFPECGESADIAGYITEECEKECGLKQGVPVVFGSGDQQAQSIGNGVFQEGSIIANIGTGGQISAFIKEPVYDPKLRTHTFCHAVRKAYTIYGATLCSGMSLNWFRDSFFPNKKFSALSEMAAEVPAGSEGLLYLPYLSGERTPHMDPKAKGMFFGMTLGHDGRHFARAVMEGVVFSLRDSLTIFKELGIDGEMIIASGGGAKSEVWLQIQADIFHKKVKVCTVKEQACLGACIIAGTGCGIFSSVAEGAGQLVSFCNRIYIPSANNGKLYDQQYEKFRKLYDATKEFM